MNCTCPAYAFPHRAYSGVCAGHEQEALEALPYEQAAHECELSAFKRERDEATQDA